MADANADAYDRVAQRYEERFLNELDGKPRDRELLDELAEHADGPIIEIGCGPGQIGAFLRDRGCRVVGVDLSREMASLAGRRLDGALVADMRSLPIASDTASAVVAFYSVIHLARGDLVTAFHEFARAVTPGGRVMVSAHEGDGEVTVTQFLDEPVQLTATFYALDELVDAATAAGLSVIHAERRDPYASEGTTVRLYVMAQRARTRRNSPH
jgi:SAM-dependent methyltransferase